MKKKDEEAFLKSIINTLPIKKRDSLKKSQPILKKHPIKTKKISPPNILPSETEYKISKSKSFYKLEKSNINKKLKQGKIQIDKKIDFHGMSLIDAEELFFNSVTNCYKKNLRCILFVTGKKITKNTEEEDYSPKLYYGKIRNSFLSWVYKQEIQKYILSVEQAGIEYGADGAFFVYLRKPKY